MPHVRQVIHLEINTRPGVIFHHIVYIKKQHFKIKYPFEAERIVFRTLLVTGKVSFPPPSSLFFLLSISDSFFVLLCSL